MAKEEHLDQLVKQSRFVPQSLFAYSDGVTFKKSIYADQKSISVPQKNVNVRRKGL